MTMQNPIESLQDRASDTFLGDELAFADCHSPEAVRLFYRACRLPVRMFGSRPCLITDAGVGLVSMPAEVGKVVCQRLGDPPVLLDSRWQMCSFVVIPDRRVPRSAWPQLVRLGIRTVAQGRHILLPTHNTPAGLVHWVSPPRTHTGPPLRTVVIRTAREARPCEEEGWPCLQ